MQFILVLYCAAVYVVRRDNLCLLVAVAGGIITLLSLSYLRGYSDGMVYAASLVYFAGLFSLHAKDQNVIP